MAFWFKTLAVSTFDIAAPSTDANTFSQMSLGDKTHGGFAKICHRETINALIFNGDSPSRFLGVSKMS